MQYPDPAEAGGRRIEMMNKPAFLKSKSKTIKGMTGKEQVSLVVAMIQGSKVASRWDSTNDYPKVSEVKQLVARSEGVIDFAVKVFRRYCPE